MRDIIKIGILFVMASLILSLFASYIVNIFASINGSLNYITTGSLGLVLSSLLTTIGGFIDTLFLNSFNGYTMVFAPSTTIISISFVLTLFRLLFGLTLAVLITSLIFGKKW